jgi:MFS family permease
MCSCRARGGGRGDLVTLQPLSCYIKVKEWSGSSLAACSTLSRNMLTYLSYKRNELATRGAIFYCMTAVAGSANGLLAYAIQETMNGVNGWSSWRWIFFIEGMMTPRELLRYHMVTLGRYDVCRVWNIHFVFPSIQARQESHDSQRQ